ncbi:MAG: V-type ATP synthase subunit F [Spirochaetaceae bacterium]|nr:V-type ATP synthase subunit F [Spirochaetaceae bacterium]
MKYFVIGERELVLAFSLVGVSGETAVNRSEVLNAFRRITGSGTASVNAPAISERPKVLILTEEAASMIEEEVREWQMNGDYPLIVEIPALAGHMSGKKSLTDAIREAVGIHL